MNSKKNSNKIMSKVIQITISILLFIYLFSTTHFDKVLTLLKNMKLEFFFIALFIAIISVIIFSLSWQLILKKLSIELQFKVVNKILFQGLFINNFATFIGGDIFCGYKLSELGMKKNIVFSLLFNRIIRIYSLFLIAGVMLVLFGSHNFIAGETKLAGIFTLLMLILLIIYYFIHRIKTQNTIVLFTNEFKINKSFLSFIKNIKIFSKDFKYFSFILIINIIANLTGIISIWFLSKSLGMTTELKDIFMIVSLLRIFLIIPISFNGIGIRELGFVGLFAKFGLDKIQALSLGLLTSFIAIILSLIGGLLIIESMFKTIKKVQ